MDGWMDVFTRWEAIDRLILANCIYANIVFVSLLAVGIHVHMVDIDIFSWQILRVCEVNSSNIPGD